MLGARKALAVIIRQQHQHCLGWGQMGGSCEKEPTATYMALGPPKKKQHQAFGALGAHMGEEQSLTSSNP